jgi:hypothetical protein
MNRVSLLRLWLLAVALTSSSVLKASSDGDRLYQVNLSEFPKYRTLLLGKLGPTPFNFGRVMIKPAFAPEYSVSIYSRSLASGEMKYLVTYLAAEHSLWETSDAGGETQDAKHTNVRQIDCEIPKEIADKIRLAWLGMLTGNQRPTRMREEDAARTTDATIAEFSIQVSPSETLYGEIAVEAPTGQKTKALSDLANTLVEYCKAKTTDRSEIGNRIDEESNRLLGLLKQG